MTDFPSSPETERVAEDWSCAADFLDDIEVDAKGMCRWTDVANAQTHIRASLRSVQPRGYAQTPAVPDRAAIYSAAKEGNLAFWRASAAQEKAYTAWKASGFIGDCPQEMRGTIVDYIADAVLATLTDTSTDRPVPNFFGEKVDAWGAAEWFDRMAKAIHEQDAAVVTKDEAVMEICRNVAASSAMRLVRGYEQQVRAALAVTSPDRTDTRPNRQGE